MSSLSDSACTATNSLDILPSDCLNAVLSFLPLAQGGVLTLGAVSTRFLMDIQPELASRRLNFTRLYYNDKARRRAVVVENRENNELRQLLPTVQERIELLSRAVPSSHHCCADIIQLRESLNNTNSSNLESDTDDDGRKVPALLAQQRRTLHCHKLHASMLSRVTVLANPPHYAHATLGGGEENVLSVPLERYIGDVLCAYYLMGHENLIEGGLPESQLIQSILKEVEIEADQVDADPTLDAIPTSSVSASSWYRTWVFIHSSVLRLAPFSWTQQSRLGIFTSPQPPPVDVALGTLFRPPEAFTGCCKLAVMRTLSRLTNFSSLKVRFNNFGPLGPAFRGRDLVESISYHPVSVMGMCIFFQQEQLDDCSRPFVRAWANEEDAVIQCLLLLHEQSRKIRPMTVLPPLVSLRGATR